MNDRREGKSRKRGTKKWVLVSMERKGNWKGVNEGKKNKGKNGTQVSLVKFVGDY